MAEMDPSLARAMTLAKALELSFRANKVFLPRTLPYRPMPARKAESPSWLASSATKTPRRRALEIWVHRVFFKRMRSGARGSSMDLSFAACHFSLCLYARAQGSVLGSRLVEMHQVRVRVGLEQIVRVVFELDFDGLRDADVYLALFLTPAEDLELNIPNGAHLAEKHKGGLNGSSVVQCEHLQTVFSNKVDLSCPGCVAIRDSVLSAPGVDDDRILTEGRPALLKEPVLLSGLVSLWKWKPHEVAVTMALPLEQRQGSWDVREGLLEVMLEDIAGRKSGWVCSLSVHWNASMGSLQWHRRCATGVVHRVDRWERNASKRLKPRTVRAEANPRPFILRWGNGNEQLMRKCACPICGMYCGGIDGLLLHVDCSHRGLSMVPVDDFVFELFASSTWHLNLTLSFCKRTKQCLRMPDYCTNATPWDGISKAEIWRDELEVKAINELKDLLPEERVLMMIWNATKFPDQNAALFVKCQHFVQSHRRDLHDKGLMGYFRLLVAHFLSQRLLTVDQASQVIDEVAS